MQTVNERLRSFIKTGPLRWPHPDSFIATPKALAEAGFYHDPSEDDPDNVICFMCSKELGGWDGDDDPYRVHISKSPKCPWALTRCAVESDFDSHGKFRPSSPSRYPDNKTLEKARLDTFGGRKKWWMHDKTKNHGANSKKMSKAGFIYTPQTPGDDTATCYYCDLSLSGWDEEDDPLEEHKRRESRSGKPCPFFSHDPQSDSPKSTTKSTNTEKPSIPAKDQDPEPDRAPTRKSVRKPKASHAKQTHASVSVPDLAPEPKPAPSKKSKKSTAPKAPRPKAVQVQEPIQVIQHEEVVVKPREEPERIKSLEPEHPGPEPLVSELEVEPTQPEQHLEEPEPEPELELELEPEPEVEPEPNPNPDPDPDSILPPANDAASPSLLTSDPIGFLPPLATSPIKLIRHLTEEERAMTVEQWIRHEMEVQYQTLKRDGERRIQAFKRHAAEVRTQIEAL